LDFSKSDVYRDIEVYVENPGTKDAKMKAMMAATGDGRVYSVRYAEINGKTQVIKNYLGDFGIRFPYANIVTDIKFYPEAPKGYKVTDASGRAPDRADGYFLLFSDGSIYSVVGSGKPVKVAKNLTDSRNNPAVDLEIVSIEQDDSGKITGLNGYVLLAKGQIKHFGKVKPLVDSPNSPSPIFKAMELYGDGAVIADGYGRFYLAHTPGSPNPDIALPSLNFGRNNVLEAFEIQVDPNVKEFNGVGIFAVTNIGTIHTSGAADFFLTAEGVKRRTDLVIKEINGIKFGSLDITFDIIRDISVYMVPNAQ